MYAIRHKDTFKWYYGIDRKFTPPRVKQSFHQAKFFNKRSEAEENLPSDDFEVVMIRATPLDERRHYDKRPVSL